MTTLDPNDGYCVLINTFMVSPDKADKLADVLHEASEPIGKMPGFISANLHISSDKTRVVNYARWRSREDMQAMLKHPDAQPHMKEAADLADSFEPILYDLRYVVERPAA